ncbi:MAG: hypothetical protein UT24_C0005G0012 [Candidatus Woesebacteria bacterium GW2011_GWB1_39_12]|uniref:Uncharacterized protein n=2 Tax=Candidatus Woeseibacteriota TaxID=1752722 RepID=A0A0G0PIS5_9BACT|nr:MAG: hypothetical protein UT23_C0006G0035 [Candidatus Woesebacteria bacterium GW2011_GWA1_39_12]KKR01303.1 MAG: hypothetical protein UT24_C0005G0012 [Candidatus Woesebacteria bacterium GW2011_GWB1_39_12]
MKRILSIAIAFSLVLFVFAFLKPQKAFAQTFDCVPVPVGPVSQRCQPNENTDTCGTGYGVDDSVCATHSGNVDEDADECRADVNNPCILTAEPCPSGGDCRSYGSGTLCEDEGGTPTICRTTSDTVGNCCIPPTNAGCPTDWMSCTELIYRGGCGSPCVQDVRGGGRGPLECQCVVNNNPPGGVACGQPCLEHEDCDSACGYCRASGPGTPRICQAAQASIGGSNLAIFCDPVDSGACTGSTNSNLGGICTAVGCIPVEDTQGFTSFLLRWGMGLAGGIAFVLMIYAGFLIITSAGNPQRVQAGKELLTAAIMGLVLLLFGAYLLRFIGVQILQIPGFGNQ